MKRDKEAGRDSGIPITVRQLEAIIRISEALAKMEMCDEVDINHVEEALRLFTVSTLDSANKDRALAGEQLTEEDKAICTKLRSKSVAELLVGDGLVNLICKIG